MSLGGQRLAAINIHRDVVCGLDAQSGFATDADRNKRGRSACGRHIAVAVSKLKHPITVATCLPCAPICWIAITVSTNLLKLVDIVLIGSDVLRVNYVVSERKDESNFRLPS